MHKEDTSKKGEKQFYPDYLFEIVMVVFLTLELVIIVTLLWPPRIGRLIDFTAPYHPMPEWYFLWLYQLIRYFPGKWIFVGTVIVPLLTVLLLFFIPWIDKTRWGPQKVWLITLVLLLGFIVLTVLPFI